MSALLARLRRKIASLERPAPRALVAWYLSRRWHASVDSHADIRYPARLQLGRGAKLGRCTVICTGPVVLGAEVDIRDHAVLDAQGGPIRIGDRTGVNPFCVLYGAGGLEIGCDGLVAAHTVIIPSNHRFDRMDVPIREQGTSGQGVRVGNDVWLASHAVVLDGVTIGDGAVVAAGAVVSRSVEPREIVGGVPARRLRLRGQPPVAGPAAT
jgi:acetyltransferase-like isoleucine patch superfamily enzyme